MTRSRRRPTRRQWLHTVAAGAVTGALGFHAARLAAAEPGTVDGAAAPPDAWPTWRGNPHCTGVSRSPRPAKLELLWRRSFPQDSFEAGAVISAGLVFVGGVDALHAVDLTTGEPKWNYPVPLGFTSSPAVRGNLVIAGDVEGRVHAVDVTTGKMVWGHALSQEVGAGPNFHGADVLITSKDGTLACLEAATGKSRWTYAIEDMIQCSPCVAGDLSFLTGCDSKLHLVNLADGAGVGTIDLGAPVGSTPSFVDGSAGGRLYFGSSGKVVQSIDLAKREFAWTTKPSPRTGEFETSPAVFEGRLFIGGKHRVFHAFDAATGEQLWYAAGRGRFDASPAVWGGLVFTASSDGRILAFEPKDGSVAWEYEAGGAFSAAPAIAAGRLVIGSRQGELLCFGGPRA